MYLNDRQKLLLQGAANKLGINYAWLYDLINFESKFDPQIKNPYSSARGLIQFIDSTARSLGYRDSLDLVTKLPTFEKQLFKAVVPYLKQYAPFYTEQSLYMSVFYPKYRHVAPDTVFPEMVQRVNPGIVTVSDYVDKVRGKKKKIIAGSATGIILLLTGIVLFKYNKGSKYAKKKTRRS